MNMMDALDIAGPLLIALGTLPIAAGMARLALNVVLAALYNGPDATPTSSAVPETALRAAS